MNSLFIWCCRCHCLELPVVLQRTTNKCTKNYYPRAKPLCCLLTFSLATLTLPLWFQAVVETYNKSGCMDYPSGSKQVAVLERLPLVEVLPYGQEINIPFPFQKNTHHTYLQSKQDTPPLKCSHLVNLASDPHSHSLIGRWSWNSIALVTDSRSAAQPE